MKSYTIVYGEFINIGSHTTQFVKYKHISCKPEDLKETVENATGWDCVHFIFDGHCEQTLD